MQAASPSMPSARHMSAAAPQEEEGRPPNAMPQAAETHLEPLQPSPARTGAAGPSGVSLKEPITQAAEPPQCVWLAMQYKSYACPPACGMHLLLARSTNWCSSLMMHGACRDMPALPLTQAPDCADTPASQSQDDDYAHFDATLPSQEMQPTPTGPSFSFCTCTHGC